ncbi:MAG: relaxase MobL [Firmicutes bacterium]|nr:relaxase MobL [Bacillota bacterium]
MAAKAPFVMKIKYYLPTKDNMGKNAEHIDYIANRPGADKGELEPENRSVEVEDDYVEYINARPGSHGLFGESTEKEMDIDLVQEELRNHNGLVWRMILSLREDDAVRLGYCNREAWEKVLQSQIKTAAEKMGIERTNLNWCAAFHEAKGHPHTHVVFWEKNPQRTTGRLASDELQGIKKTFAGEIFREERLKVMMEKSAMRELVRSEAKGSLTKAKEVVKELKRVADSGSTDLKIVFGTSAGSLPPELIREKELAQKLYTLSRELPGKGQAAFQFMPQNVKERALEVADYTLSRPGFEQEVSKYLMAQEQLARTYSSRPEQIKAAREKAYQDLQKRVANLVVRGAADLNMIEKQDRWEERNKTLQTGRTVNIVWKSCWRAVERERQLCEAQAEMQKRISSRKQSLQKNNSAENGRHRENNLERSNEE